MFDKVDGVNWNNDSDDTNLEKLLKILENSLEHDDELEEGVKDDKDSLGLGSACDHDDDAEETQEPGSSQLPNEVSNLHSNSTNHQSLKGNTSLGTGPSSSQPTP